MGLSLGGILFSVHFYFQERMCVSEDGFFRLIAIIIFISFSILRSTRKSQEASSQAGTYGKESRLWMAWARFGYPFWFLSIMFYMADSRWLNNVQLPLPIGLRFFGILVAVVGFILLWWTHHALDDNFSVCLKLKDDHRLIMGGPYRFIRHPMYLSFIVIIASICLISANTAVIVTNILTAVFLCSRINNEEDMMRERFGDEYAEYSMRTGRLLPKIGRVD